VTRETGLARRIRQLVEVPSTDPDDARRRQLLNILLLGMGVLNLLALLVVLVADIADLYDQEWITYLYQVGFLLLAGLATIYAINRYWASRIASVLFLLLLTAILAFSDEPYELVQGRSLIVFTIPIVMASIILPPAASFAAAGLSALALLLTSLRVNITPNPFAILVFFAIAMASWLSSRSLERVLRDLRLLNRELDQRVEERTRQVAEALSRNQAILEAIADGIIVFDTNGRASLVNPAMTHLLQRPAQEIVGNDLDALLGDDTAQGDHQAIGDLLRGNDRSHSGLRFELHNKTLSVSFAPVRDSTDNVAGTVAVFRDFTREAEIDRMKSAFVSMASHELRTPLNAILGYVDMLQEGVYGALSEQQHDVVSRIIANVGELLNIVNNLLDQAQIEAGKLTLNNAPFSPTDLVEGVHGVMSVLAHAKGLELTRQIDANIPAVLIGDRQRLYEILVNLVSNAIKFTAQGSVHIRAQRHGAEQWLLEVVDTGRGIPQEAQAYIFEPFRRVDDSATRGDTGVGLGLSIVKQLVQLMGGEITLSSELNRGSTFTIVLPLIPTQEASWAADSH